MTAGGNINPEIHIAALTPEHAEQAGAWAKRLGLSLAPSDSTGGYVLQVGNAGLQLALPSGEPPGSRADSGAQAGRRAIGSPGVIRVDFLSGALAHRRRFGGGSGQMIAKAVGIQPGVRPAVLDATAGLGRDAFVLAQLGCSLTLIERQPVIAALLEDGLRRAADDPESAAIVARMRLFHGDAIVMMRNWRAEPPQVIYLDPMFPHRQKSALVKKEMRGLRPLVGDDDDAPALLAAALDLASHRVVVKRARQASPVTGRMPGYALSGQSSRFDIYPKRSLKPAACAAPTA